MQLFIQIRIKIKSPLRYIKVPHMYTKYTPHMQICEYVCVYNNACVVRTRAMAHPERTQQNNNLFSNFSWTRRRAFTFLHRHLARPDAAMYLYTTTMMRSLPVIRRAHKCSQPRTLLYMSFHSLYICTTHIHRMLQSGHSWKQLCLK